MSEEEINKKKEDKINKKKEDKIDKKKEDKIDKKKEDKIELLETEEAPIIEQIWGEIDGIFLKYNVSIEMQIAILARLIVGKADYLEEKRIGNK